MGEGLAKVSSVTASSTLTDERQNRYGPIANCTQLLLSRLLVLDLPKSDSDGSTERGFVQFKQVYLTSLCSAARPFFARIAKCIDSGPTVARKGSACADYKPNIYFLGLKITGPPPCQSLDRAKPCFVAGRCVVLFTPHFAVSRSGVVKASANSKVVSYHLVQEGWLSAARRQSVGFRLASFW